MKFLIIALSCFLSVCANAQTDKKSTIKINDDYAFIIDCSLTKGTRSFHLVRGSENVFSLIDSTIELPDSAEEYEEFAEKCISDVEFIADFDGNGLKVIAVSQGDTLMAPMSSQTIYTINTETNIIKLIGELPINTSLQADHTFLFVNIGQNGISKIVYSLQPDKIIVKKSSFLMYNGSVCIKKEKGIAYADFDCKGGIVATKKFPVCVEGNFGQRPKIIPLHSCDSRFTISNQK